MEKLGVTIVGAGVIGLSIGWELSRQSKDLLVIEKNGTFGQETSSRNSEVIHAGIYYPNDFLKRITCIEGRHLLYEFCQAYGVPFKRIGKLIVAVEQREIPPLQNLMQQGVLNDVSDLRWLSAVEIKKYEPYIKAEAAIYSPSTGIVNSHLFMKQLAQQIQSRWAQIAYNTQLVGIDKDPYGFKVTVKDDRGGHYTFLSKVVVNAAGLYADKVASMVGIDGDIYRLRFCKGDYFRVSAQKSKFINSLIYPLPHEEKTGLGIHATVDMSGSVRLGPDVEYINSISYSIDPAKGKLFYENVRTFLPFIDLKDLTPDQSGIRPKLYGKGETIRDFIIRDETVQGVPGFINLVGIESPGLTASLSIARMVGGMVKTALS